MNKIIRSILKCEELIEDRLYYKHFIGGIGLVLCALSLPVHCLSEPWGGLKTMHTPLQRQSPIHTTISL